MSLSLALNNALSGLRINQQSIGVLSQNVANVNTSGYSRQVVSQSAVTVQGQGSGVAIDEITRKIDKYLQRSMQTQGSNFSSTQAVDTYYQRLQAVLGQPGAANSMDSVMTGFFNAVQLMAETPETVSLKANVVSAGSNFAKQVSDLAANVFDLRFEADREIGNAAATVNATLDRLYGINAALSQASSLRQNNAGLLDERDRALNTLSEYMNISATFGDNGRVSVVGGDGLVLLEEGVRHHLRYSQAQSANVFVQDSPLGALDVVALSSDGKEVGGAFPLLTAGKSAEVQSKVSGGKIAALQQVRDVKFPAVLQQLDELAAKVRDAINTLHNQGSGFPPPTSLTGDRAVRATDQFNWSGAARIAVLKSDGSAVSSGYSDEQYTGVRPLTLDLSKLNSGAGNGKPTLQTIIDEINNHFGSPGNKAELGNINNIQLVSDNASIPAGSGGLFNFDLDVDNISTTRAQIFVTGATVLNDVGTSISGLTQTAPSLSLQTTNSYTTTLGSADVTINLATPPTVAVGDTIYMNPPSAAVNGISVANLTGFFTVKSVSGNQVTFTAAAAATATGAVNDAGNIQMMPPYDYVIPGQKIRLRDAGQMQVDFGASPNSTFYDVTLNVTVVGEDGVVNTAPITYRVRNNQSDTLNQRYDTTAVGVPGTLVTPGTSQESLRAMMVDENGRELPTVNGKYIDAPGFLKLVGGNAASTYGVAIDEMDSQQLGKADASPIEPGTNWGFSHYFGLNNFYTSNLLTATGDTVRNSAYNLAVQSRLKENPNLVATGKLEKQGKSPATNNKEVYTYVRYAGENSVAQAMAKLNSQVISFDAAGGLPTTQLSLLGYASQVIGFVSQRSAEATDNAANAKTLYDGFKSKSDAVSGVNLDEELANTVTLQNAYSASARVITMVNQMYDDLLKTL